MLTIARLGSWGINYYEKTADRSGPEGGLTEYYSEGNRRAPRMVLAGDQEAVAELVGLPSGHVISEKQIHAWWSEAQAPSGAMGRAFAAPTVDALGRSRDGVHGFDLTFAAPKSVSVMRGMADPQMLGQFTRAHRDAVKVALEYLNQHAGYTRRHNPVTGNKDLEKLPGLALIEYNHETSRAGDPHLHSHMILPNRQARADGKLASLDSKSLYHEARAAGMVYQTALRDGLSQRLGVLWGEVNRDSGVAEIVGVNPQAIKLFSKRKTQLDEWVRENVDGRVGAAATAAGQRATKVVKGEDQTLDELRDAWESELAEHGINVVERGNAIAPHNMQPPTVDEVLEFVRQGRSTWTRADLVEAVGTLWPPSNDDPREVLRQIEALTDEAVAQCWQSSVDRAAHHREGSIRFTSEEVVVEEAAALEMAGRQDPRLRMAVGANTHQVLAEKMSEQQAETIRAVVTSDRGLNLIEAPAGAGKTTSLRGLRAACEENGRDMVLLAPTGRAADAGASEDVAPRTATVDSELSKIADNKHNWTTKSVIVVDEAAMTSNRKLTDLLRAAHTSGAKLVFVGDSHQLDPVKARAGLFAMLHNDLPWSQELTEVFRQKDPHEREAGLALRNGSKAGRALAVDWYVEHGRVHAGNDVAMAHDALRGFLGDVDAGKDALLISDTWAVSDALNAQVQHALGQQRAGHDYRRTLPSTTVAREHTVYLGDTVMTLQNLSPLDVEVTDAHHNGIPDDSLRVRNGHRWTVIGLRDNGDLWVQRTTDSAQAWIPAEYARTNVVLGYAGTVHSAQGATADTCHTVMSSESGRRELLYPGLTRGKESNQLYLTEKINGEAEHQHGTGPEKGFTEIRFQPAKARHLMASVADRSTADQAAHRVAEIAILEHTDTGAPLTGSGIAPRIVAAHRTRDELRAQRLHEYLTEQRAARHRAAAHAAARARDTARGHDLSR
ncbi:MobF family relaxase [Tsukamurella hominis]|uniref:MobF family relaxase n=1 Tax=Tsukamurella hominis TaxID=1970232 RepID=UPI0039EC6CCD